MLNGKIEFYGENLSLFAISKKIGISRDTLNKHYEQTGDIYEAERICKKIIEEREASLVEYNGERLAIQTIAKKVGIKDPKTLKKYYEQTGDIYQAIKKYDESKIEYNGEKMTLDAIAKKAGVKRDTLETHYNKSGNIYEAVEYCLELKRKAEESKVNYNGERRTITSIAKEIGIDKKTLKKYYEQTGDIEKAIEAYQEAKQKSEESKLEYEGELKSLKSIAKDENVAETTLTRYIKKYKNIDKAVFMARIQRQKTRKVKLKNESFNLYDLSLMLGIKYSELLNMMNKGMSVEQIKAENQEHPKRKKIKQDIIKLSNGQTLLEYCIENRLNYSFIYRAINTYGRTLDEAIKEYQTKGSNLPNNWVFEKYGILLRHLMTENGVDVQRVVDYMRKEQLSMSEAIEKYIVRKNSKKYGVDADWMQEVYSVLTDENMADEYDEFKKIFYVDDKEEECIIQSYDEVQDLDRKLLLFEIAEAIKENIFTQDEMTEILQVYEVKPKEIETIFLDLYGKYDNKILLGKEQYEAKKRNTINEIARKWYYMTEDERKRALVDNKITSDEANIIADLSGNIVKYKKMLISKEKDCLKNDQEQG